MFDKLEADVLFLDGNYELAANMYHEGAREGDALAAFNYGYCLWRGLGRDYDPTEAKSFFTFARDLEGGAACYNLAMLYLHGEGVTRNFTRALEYMQIAADMKCVEAELYMGMAHTLGCMFEPEVIGISLIPYHKAEYRDINTPLLEGEIFDPQSEDERFAVVRADARAAFEYFRSAARHTDTTYIEELVAKGKFLYAKCYLDGLGTEFDRVKGTRLMLLAGKSGSSEAISYLAENGFTPERILAAGKKEE